MRSSLVLVFVACAASAAAQPPSLKLPSTVYLAAAGADWSATVWCQRGTNCQEANPLLSWLNTRGGTPAVVAVGVGIDIATVWAIHRYVPTRHRRWAAIGLYAGAAGRIYAASTNIRYGRRWRQLAELERHPYVFR